MEAIRTLNVRLDRTTIENVSWERCVDFYDRPATFFFLDSPYTDCNAGAYGSWTYAEVQALRDRLAKVRGQWLVTLNDSPAIRDIFRGCRFQEVSRPRGINNQSGSTLIYRELIIQPPLEAATQK